jgi:hypothetical protein
MTTGDPASNRPDRWLTIVAWSDSPLAEADGGIPTRSDEALYRWTPILGPTAMLMAHRFAACVEDRERTTLTVAEIAAILGLGRAVAKVGRSISRLERYGIARAHDDAVAIRIVLPPPSRRLRAQLPLTLVEAVEQRR